MFASHNHTLSPGGAHCLKQTAGFREKLAHTRQTQLNRDTASFRVPQQAQSPLVLFLMTLLWRFTLVTFSSLFLSVTPFEISIFTRLAKLILSESFCGRANSGSSNQNQGCNLQTCIRIYIDTIFGAAYMAVVWVVTEAALWNFAPGAMRVTLKVQSSH